jgi:hypothetical protein
MLNLHCKKRKIAERSQNVKYVNIKTPKYQSKVRSQVLHGLTVEQKISIISKAQLISFLSSPGASFLKFLLLNGNTRTIQTNHKLLWQQCETKIQVEENAKLDQQSELYRLATNHMIHNIPMQIERCYKGSLSVLVRCPDPRRVSDHSITVVVRKVSKTHKVECAPARRLDQTKCFVNGLINSVKLSPSPCNKYLITKPIQGNYDNRVVYSIANRKLLYSWGSFSILTGYVPETIASLIISYTL